MGTKTICIVSLLFLVGCAHCSKTVTDFNGKTSGINPYGKGDIKIHRESTYRLGDCYEPAEDTKEAPSTNSVQ